MRGTNMEVRLTLGLGGFEDTLEKLGGSITVLG